MSPTKYFGSDVYTHYTATYAWNSHQMAHATMGLADTMLFVRAAPRLGLEVWYGALFFLIPFLKDTADYWVDRSNIGGVFGETPVHRRELLVDRVTDNLFWSVGMVLALFMALSRDGTPWYLYVVFVAAVLLIVAAVCCVGRLFNAQKRRYNSSGLPYYFRLPCYDGNLVAAWVFDSKASRDATSPVEGGRTIRLPARLPSAASDTRGTAELKQDHLGGRHRLGPDRQGSNSALYVQDAAHRRIQYLGRTQRFSARPSL